MLCALYPTWRILGKAGFFFLHIGMSSRHASHFTLLLPSNGSLFGFELTHAHRRRRWVMFGIAVGLLTEYATGSNFIDQLKIIVSNLGILDLE